MRWGRWETLDVLLRDYWADSRHEELTVILRLLWGAAHPHGHLCARPDALVTMMTEAVVGGND